MAGSTIVNHKSISWTKSLPSVLVNDLSFGSICVWYDIFTDRLVVDAIQTLITALYFVDYTLFEAEVVH